MIAIGSSKKRRVIAVISIVWITAVFLLALNGSYSYSYDSEDGRATKYFDLLQFINIFLIVGLGPVLLMLAIAWIRGEQFSVSPCPECGAQMRFHSPKLGDQAGRLFLVCRRFPECQKVLFVSTQRLKYTGK